MNTIDKDLQKQKKQHTEGQASELLKTQALMEAADQLFSPEEKAVLARMMELRKQANNNNNKSNRKKRTRCT